MTGMRRAALALGGTLLAWTGPPVPPPPPHYQAPLWPLPAPGPGSAPRDGTTYALPERSPDSAAAEVVAAVNRHRVQAGCRPVRLRASLNRAARSHSADMARRQRLTHTGGDGSGPADRMRAAGYDPGHTAENIAAGPRTPEAAVRTWIDSPEHRVILLTCRYTHAGAGVAPGAGGPWWTLDLATGR
ncbi:CAP domain-containing protein [Streptomyces sp. NPDC086081]|uniref:CAP domain-containing protein n=1 Tax=Streptomyces sp. NPDC086081 TaxID=3365749 RepID=UPI00381F6644